MIRKISWKLDEDPTWFISGLNLELGGCWGFLNGDLTDRVIFHIIDHDWEDILKVWWRSDMIYLRKSFSQGGWVGRWVGWWGGIYLSLSMGLSRSIDKICLLAIKFKMHISLHAQAEKKYCWTGLTHPPRYHSLFTPPFSFVENPWLISPSAHLSTTYDWGRAKDFWFCFIVDTTCTQYAF